MPPVYAEHVQERVAASGGNSRGCASSVEGMAMGLIDFVKDAGEKLFGIGKAKAAMAEAAAAPADEAKVTAANNAAADAILEYIKTQNLTATALTVTFDGATATASVFGVAPSQAVREKIVLCCGNVAGVVAVKDMMSVDQSEPEATYYTVVAGDNLSKISKAQYGDPNKYMKIYEANTPMLKHPDKIYPGQVLRIPPL
jgi:nucleoid-associated protein YgaU